jgi:signal transduction histidine kinase
MSDRRPLILNVDDDAAARYARHRVLTRAGYDVIDVGTGQGALDHLRDEPELVVLDVGLPDIDGYEVCRRIKSNPETAFIVVVQVSASFVKSADRTRALEGGADTFVVEPVEPEVLVATVNAMLRMRQAEAAVRTAAREWTATFDAIGEGVALLDAEGRIVRTNQAFATLAALPAEGLVGRAWGDIVEDLSHDDSRVDPSTVGIPATRPSFRCGERWIQVGETEIPGSGHAARVVVLTDVTDHFRALIAAQEANRLKDEFLAVLSHELRTPLNAIVGWAHLLQAGNLGAPESARALETIARNAQAQNQLISDILDVSRIVAGKLRLEAEPMRPAAAVDAAVGTVAPAALAKGIRLFVEIDPATPAIAADTARLQQVIWNLLSNAIKFSPPGGQVRVALRPAGPWAELVVEDEGPGIDASFLPFVFDRFRQADSSSTRPKGGLGLGLAIVRHLVELHGGTVEARNRTDRSGAAFIVRLPAAADAHAANPVVYEAASLDAGPSLEGLRVLIVDDEQDGLELAAAILAARGARVLTASSAAEAVPVLEREALDVLLCDIEMPGEDGYSFLRRVRETLAVPAVPSVALTAYAGPEDRARALAAGYDTHISKPARPLDLVNAVAALAARATSIEGLAPLDRP